MSHHGGRGYTLTKQIRAERRDRAELVAQESGYSKLTTVQKLERVLAFIAVPGNGKAAKQLAKLEKQLAKEREPKPQTTKEKKVVGLDFGGAEVLQEQIPDLAICPMPIFEGDDTETPHNKRGKKARKK